MGIWLNWLGSSVKMVEHLNQSQPNHVSEHQPHLVLGLEEKLIIFHISHSQFPQLIWYVILLLHEQTYFLKYGALSKKIEDS